MPPKPEAIPADDIRVVPSGYGTYTVMIKNTKVWESKSETKAKAVKEYFATKHLFNGRYDA